MPSHGNYKICVYTIQITLLKRVLCIFLRRNNIDEVNSMFLRNVIAILMYTMMLLSVAQQLKFIIRMVITDYKLVSDEFVSNMLLLACCLSCAVELAKFLKLIFASAYMQLIFMVPSNGCILTTCVCHICTL